MIKLLQMIIVAMTILFFSVAASACGMECSLQEGDIIFQKSQSRQSKAIQEVTGSEWTHMGIIFLNKDKWSVYEAVQPVKITSLESFISRGKNKEFVVKRYTSDLTIEQKSKLKHEASKYLGFAYDILFEPSDKAIYCSEFVWKVYKRALGIEIAHFKPFHSLNYRSSAALKLAKKRYEQVGRKFILHQWKQQKVITPVDMMGSPEIKPTLRFSFEDGLSKCLEKQS